MAFDPISLGLTGVGLIGSLFSSSKDPASGDFDYDPERRALKRYGELTNPNSPYYKAIMKHYQSVLSMSTPTLDTLTSFNKSAGISDAGSTAIATNQAKAYSAQMRDKASLSVMDQFLRTEGIAQGYLGQEADRAKTQTLGYQGALKEGQNTRTSFYDQLLGLGGGLLGRQLGNNPYRNPLENPDKRLGID